MTRRPADALGLRREALMARATLQRVQLRSTLQQLSDATGSTQRVGGVALRCARWLVASRSAGTHPAARARPWMLSAAWLLVRSFRRHPTVRWLTAAAAAGTAIWWVARAIKAPDVTDDGSG